MSTRTYYDTYIYVKLYLILPVIVFHYQLYQVIMQEVPVLDKTRLHSITVKWLSRFANLHNIGPVRSVILPEIVTRGQVCIFARRIDLKNKTIIKRALQRVCGE